MPARHKRAGDPAIRNDTVSGLDNPKRDMTVSYGDRTFAVRAYRDGGAWHGLIIENKTPLRNTLAPAIDSASYFAAAVQFVAALVDAGSAPRREITSG
jgi:hypothetical protein